MERDELEFGSMRRLVSRIDRVSMLLDDSSYENFARIDDVPPKYDQMIVRGIGIIESEFPVEGDLRPSEARENAIGHGMFFGRCLEFWVSRPGPSARSVDSKLRSAAAELDMMIAELPETARKHARWASEDIANAIDNMEDVSGAPPDATRAAGALASAVENMAEAGVLLAEAADTMPPGSAKRLDWALATLAVALDCARSAAAGGR